MKQWTFTLLSVILLLTACEKDEIEENNDDLNGKTSFTVTEENEYKYTFTETPATATITDYEGKKQLRITFNDTYAEVNKPFKAEIVINDFSGTGKYTLDKAGTLATMTDDSHDGDVYWANYYNQSGYGTSTRYYSPRTYLTVIKATDGKLVADIDMQLWHNLVASGYSNLLAISWKGHVYTNLQ
jgi:hypothetical protein